MESNRLYSLSVNEDVTIINLRSKFLILENTYINQKMTNNYVFLLTMGIKFKQFIGLWLTLLVYLRHLLQLVSDVLVSHGVPIRTLKWRLAGLIKTDRDFKLSVGYAKALPYPILILLILHLL